MVTFTLPYELRAPATVNQQRVYALLFQCAVSTLKTFAANDKAFASQLAMTAYCTPTPGDWTSIRMCTSSCLAVGSTRSIDSGAR